jgi:hypothetical protein
MQSWTTQTTMTSRTTATRASCNFCCLEPDDTQARQQTPSMHTQNAEIDYVVELDEDDLIAFVAAALLLISLSGMAFVAASCVDLCRVRRRTDPRRRTALPTGAVRVHPDQCEMSYKTS